MPDLLVFAGPNGSGKSTFIAQMRAGVRSLVVALPERMLNPDDFARAIDPLHPDRVAVSAGRAIIAQRDALLLSRLDFAIETTLAGKGEVRLLQTAKAKGYRVTLIYVATEFPEENVVRVERRREEQNRSVAAVDVLRRYRRSLAQVSDAVSQADFAYIVDNSRFDFSYVMRCEGGRIVELSENVAGWAERALAPQLAGYRSNRT